MGADLETVLFQVSHCQVTQVTLKSPTVKALRDLGWLFFGGKEEHRALLSVVIGAA